jgi:SAM-dependent methyltransferase
MSQVFDSYARYYDLLYQDKDYEGESKYIADRIHEKSPRAKSILELGCGTGVHAEHLARAGYSIHGVDLSREMLDRAEARKVSMAEDLAARLSFGHGDVREVRTGQTYDVVVSLFHVISYQPGNADLEKVFATAADHLKTAGLFLFDFWYGPAVLTQKPEVRVKRLENEEIRVTRIAEPVMRENKNLVDVNYDIFVEEKKSAVINRIHEQHKMRYLFLPELEYFLDPVKWSNYEACVWLENRPLDDSSWSAFVVAERK